MKTLCLAVLLAWLPGGDRERGLQLYKDGKYAEAAAAFRAAIEQEGDSAELQWNLALASWRGGDLPAAETAAEKYVALAKDARTDLHAGLLGAVRHDEAKALESKADAAATTPPAAGAQPADPLPLLEQALQKAQQARDHFVRGASANPTPELLRNTERALRTIDELQKKIDEVKKQREQQQKDQKDDKQDQKKDEKNDKNDKQDPQQQDKQDKDKQDKQKKDDPADPSKADDKPQPGEGEEKPEPKPEPKDGQKSDGKEAPKDDKPPAEPKPEPGEPKPEPKPSEPRKDAPGEAAEGKELTPEQAQRLLEQLRELDDRQKAIRARAKSGRRPVERDW